MYLEKIDIYAYTILKWGINNDDSKSGNNFGRVYGEGGDISLPLILSARTISEHSALFIKER